MRHRIAIAALGLCLLVPVWNWLPEQAGALAAAAAAASPIYSTTGEVVVVNSDSILIDHGAVPQLEWPPMTMTYQVQDAAILRGLQPGARVRFSFRREGYGYFLTQIARQ